MIYRDPYWEFFDEGTWYLFKGQDCINQSNASRLKPAVTHFFDEIGRCLNEGSKPDDAVMQIFVRLMDKETIRQVKKVLRHEDPLFKRFSTVDDDRVALRILQYYDPRFADWIEPVELHWIIRYFRLVARASVKSTPALRLMAGGSEREA